MLAVSNYHYIRESFDYNYPSIFGLTPKQFENQLIELSNHGDYISQSDLLKFTDSPFDKNYLLVTFDDGLSEQFELAKPILNKLGIPFICFINTINYTEKKVSLVHKIHMVRSEISSDDIMNFMKEKFDLTLEDKEKELAITNYSYDDDNSAYLKYLLNFKLTIEEQENLIDPLFKSMWNENEVNEKLYFSDKQLKTLHREGCLGSHSHQHIPLGLYSKEKIEKEYKNTQCFFKDTFGEESYSISYPYGSYESCDKVSEIGSDYNFKLGFSMERAISKSIENNPLMISRYDCNDLPLGKFNIFNKELIFSSSRISNWYPT
tara:strand:+ start:30878 stop:31837 length:960 start_codon:yes stop_codon:yes gene_type:complete